FSALRRQRAFIEGLMTIEVYNQEKIANNKARKSAITEEYQKCLNTVLLSLQFHLPRPLMPCKVAVTTGIKPCPTTMHRPVSKACCLISLPSHPFNGRCRRMTLWRLRSQ